MDFALVQELYNRCNPDEALTADDERNVDIDAQDVRGKRWSDLLARKIELSRKPVCLLFSGLRGTGKSTEIHRLSARLSSPSGKHMRTVIIDGDDALDLTTEIDVSDILALVLYHSERSVLQAEGRHPDEALKTGAFGRILDWLRDTSVELDKVSTDVVGVGVDFNFKQNPSFRSLVRKQVASHTAAFVKRVRDEMSSLQIRARAAGFTGGLCVLFDSLEKLRGTSLTWKNVLASAESIFAGGAPHLELPVHALYTIPPALQRRIADPIEFLPMIKIRDRDGALHPPGFDVIQALVGKRMPQAALEEIFGTGRVRDHLRAIALWSGGYPREVVRLLQTILEEDRFPITDTARERMLQRAGNTYRGIVYDSGAIDWLARVRETKKLIANDDREREAADLFLQNNVILRYLNDEEWVDVHPSVDGMPELALAPKSVPA